MRRDDHRRRVRIVERPDRRVVFDGSCRRKSTLRARVPTRPSPRARRREIRPRPRTSDVGPRHGMTVPLSRSASEQPRKQRSHRQLLDVAGVDAAEQRLRDEIDGLRTEAAPEERIRPIRRRADARGGIVDSSAIRARPSGESRSYAANASDVSGIPRNDGCGSACSVGPSTRTRAAGVDRASTRIETELANQIEGSRLGVEDGVGPGFDGEAVRVLRRISPPARDEASRTRTRCPRFVSSYAAERPLIPAPTTST